MKTTNGAPRRWPEALSLVLAGLVLAIAFGAALLLGLIHSVLDHTLMPMETPFAQAAITLAVFPLFAWLFIGVHRAFVKEL